LIAELEAASVWVDLLPLHSDFRQKFFCLERACYSSA